MVDNVPPMGVALGRRHHRKQLEVVFAQHDGVVCSAQRRAVDAFGRQREAEPAVDVGGLRQVGNRNHQMVDGADGVTEAG